MPKPLDSFESNWRWPTPDVRYTDEPLTAAQLRAAREDDDVDDLTNQTIELLKQVDGRPPAEQAAVLAQSLPDSSRIEYRNTYADPFAPSPFESGGIGYFLNDVHITPALSRELVQIIGERRKQECAAAGHLLPTRHCACGHVSEPGT